MWFSKYLKVYDKTIDTVPQEVFDEIKEKIASKQSLHPFVSIVLIGYNEEKRLLASLWSLSEMICK